MARPWELYTVLEEGPRFKIKRIEVKPGGSLSRNPPSPQWHWIMVSGMAKVVNGDREIFVGTNRSPIFLQDTSTDLKMPVCSTSL